MKPQRIQWLLKVLQHPEVQLLRLALGSIGIGQAHHKPNIMPRTNLITFSVPLIDI